MAAKPLSATLLINDASLVAYYPLNTSSTDFTGNYNGTDTAVIYQSSPRVNSDFIQTANYNGSTSHTTATISSNLGGSFTVMGWVYVSDVTAENAIFESHVTSYNNYWAYLSLGGSSVLRWALYDGTHNPNMVGGTTLSNSTWYQFAAVRDTGLGKILLYLNGASDATSVTDTVVTPPTYSSFDIGKRTTAAAILAGNLDDISVFSRALTSSEISGYYAGTLAANTTPTVDALVIGGGGGGGGKNVGGGGGAGDYNYETSHTVLYTAYSVVVGAGGAGGTNNDNGTNGSASTFHTMTAIGGGYGAHGVPADNTSHPGGSGGSGGGGGGNDTGGSSTGASSTGIQGSAGGNVPSSQPSGSGGGGAGGAGGVPSGAGVLSAGGNGGAGIANSISGSSVTYAVGGGGGGNLTGGTGDAGGGGHGGYGPSPTQTHATAGTANTGGGGGGSEGNEPSVGNQGKDGGSGVVIITYTTASFGTCTGGTITTNGSKTVHTFTANGTFTAVASTSTNYSKMFFLFR